MRRGLFVVMLLLAAPVAALAQSDSCQWAHDGECDEARFGGTGACPSGTDASDCRAEARAWARLMAQVPAETRTLLGDDSCRWAHDLECDDAQFGGTGACAPGTDASDCRAMAIGGDDSCRWANDGECDEPGIGTGVCASGTDTTDCAAVAFLRNRSNECASAFDGVCDEPGIGTGRCAANTDTADCVGRARPASVRDHFFGHDDRFLPDVTQLPWRAVGYLEFAGGGGCTAVLVAPALALTAAHCLIDDAGGLKKPQLFRAGRSGDRDQGRAGAGGFVISPDYSPQTRPPGQGNGDDWAIIRLDWPLGDVTGYLEVHLLDKEEMALIRSGEGLAVSQAGYSWDTGSQLSGHADCRIIAIYGDNSILHECDTTSGDSGSPIMLERGGRWHVVALDSQFFNDRQVAGAFSSAYLAVDSRAFMTALQAEADTWPQR